MNIETGSEITSSHLKAYYYNIDELCNTLNTSVSESYGKANMLYNHSSVVEDILTSNMLSLYSKLNSIAFTYSTNSAIFIESFESFAYIDKKFHVDKSLNIDTSNRSLTLPIKNTINNKIVSAIIEPDSNGTVGNVLHSYANADITTIFDNDISSIFEYEKYTSIFDSSSLALILTLKLEKYTVTNSVYVKLYSEASIKYPSVQSIEVSTDGVTWKTISGFIESFAEQNDFYIRYEAEKTRFVRIKLLQQIAQQVQTGFGIKNRYSIGIREIQVVTSEFVENGSYVSIPLTTGASISNVKLNSEYISANGIEFSISANNGGTWIPIIPNGSALILPNVNTGVLLAENIKTIRVKVGMKRTAGSSLLKNADQLQQYNSAGTYQLLGMPTSLNMYIGGHISCGGDITYNVQAPYPYNILGELFKNSGIVISAEAGGLFVAKFGSEVGIRDGLLSTSEDKALTALRNYILNNLTSMYTFKAKYIPYYYGIEDDLTLFIGGQEIPQTVTEDGIKKLLWIALSDFNSCHTNIYVDLNNLQMMQKIGNDTFINGSINTGINLQFKKFKYDPSLSLTKNEIKLGNYMISKAVSDIVITEFQDGVLVKQLGVSSYKIKDGTKDTIIINDDAFSSKSVYYISYVPVFDISFLSEQIEITSSVIEVRTLIDAPYTSKILFNYLYEDLQVMADTKYYSPICKNYKIELS